MASLQLRVAPRARVPAKLMLAHEHTGPSRHNSSTLILVFECQRDTVYGVKVLLFAQLDAASTLVLRHLSLGAVLGPGMNLAIDVGFLISVPLGSCDGNAKGWNLWGKSPTELAARRLTRKSWISRYQKLVVDPEAPILM